MKYLYKYPQAEFPYAQLLEENLRRGRAGREYELLDTGVFDQDRYFDVFVEYAKADVDDICIKITVANRGPEAARLRLLPTLWFRNTWSWKKDAAKPLIRVDQTRGNALSAFSDELGAYRLSFEGDPELLFTENETNLKR